VSDELTGVVVGGLLALGGSLVVLLLQYLMRRHGHITWEVGDCDITIFPKKNEDEILTLHSLKSLQEQAVSTIDRLKLETVLRLHNQKDVSVGLMELNIALLRGREQILTFPPRARIRYMEVQEDQEQDPFQAATLPAQQVVIVWLTGVFNQEEVIAQLLTCDRAKLLGRLSNGKAIEEVFPC
jgi:hypothetical protein